MTTGGPYYLTMWLITSQCIHRIGPCRAPRRQIAGEHTIKTDCRRCQACGAECTGYARHLVSFVSIRQSLAYYVAVGPKQPCGGFVNYDGSTGAIIPRWFERTTCNKW